MSELAHGESEVYWHGNTLVIRPSGSFNMEGVKKVMMAVAQCIANKPDGDWLRYYVYQDKATLGPMDSLPPVIEQLKKSKAIGCVGVVCVGGNNLNRQGMEMVCEQAELPLYLCDSYEEGLRIAQNLLCE